MERLEEIGFVVGTVGNYEFDEGTDEFLQGNDIEGPDSTKKME